MWEVLKLPSTLGSTSQPTGLLWVFPEDSGSQPSIQELVNRGTVLRASDQILVVRRHITTQDVCRLLCLKQPLQRRCSKAVDRLVLSGHKTAPTGGKLEIVMVDVLCSYICITMEKFVFHSLLGIYSSLPQNMHFLH